MTAIQCSIHTRPIMWRLGYACFRVGLMRLGCWFLSRAVWTVVNGNREARVVVTWTPGDGFECEAP